MYYIDTRMGLQYIVANVTYNTTALNASYYAEIYPSAEENLWIDRNQDGAVSKAEWIQMMAQLQGWNEQLFLQGLDSDATSIDTEQVANLSAGLDSGFYQQGLNYLMDANNDGQITWLEWVTAHTEANYQKYVEVLASKFAFTRYNWALDERYFTIGDTNGDGELTWAEWWMNNYKYFDFEDLAETQGGNITVEQLRTLVDADILTEFVDRDDDGNVTSDEYFEALASIAEFFELAPLGEVSYAELQDVDEEDVSEIEFEFYDGNSDGVVNVTEFQQAQMTLESEVYDQYWQLMEEA